MADLRRPPTTTVARRMVESYADDEPDVRRRDFYHLLCTAFESREVESQLEAAGLAELAVAVISDRHLVVHGCKR